MNVNNNCKLEFVKEYIIDLYVREKVENSGKKDHSPEPLAAVVVDILTKI